MLSEIKRGTKLRNAFNKETFVFSGPVDDPAVARFEVILEEGGSGGGNALLHVHPGALVASTPLMTAGAARPRFRPVPRRPGTA